MSLGSFLALTYKPAVASFLGSKCYYLIINNAKNIRDLLVTKCH